MNYELTKAGEAIQAARWAEKQGWNDVAKLYREANHAFEGKKYSAGNRLMKLAIDAERPLMDASLGRG